MADYIDREETRDEFTAQVYEILADDANNDRANQIIDVFDTLPAAEVMASMWHIIKTRPMTEEERKEYDELVGGELTDDEAVIYCSPLPENGQEVLVCYKCGCFDIDTFYDDDGCYFENNGDMDGIVAWMPLPPKPKKKET